MTTDKKRVALILFLIAFIFLINIVNVSASFQLGNPNSSIEEVYGPEENLRGWINISLQNEKAENIIYASENFNGNIKLKDFLDNNSAEYSCIPEDCESIYRAVNGEEAKSFSLDYNEEKILAFKLNGKIEKVDGLSFDFYVDNQLSCSEPLEIDILNDDSIDWKSGKLTETYECMHKGTGDSGKGCFKDENTEEVRIGNNFYCEKISLPKNKKFNLGAWIRGNDSTTWQTGLLVMEVYDLSGDKEASCNLPKPSTSGGEISCNIEFENTQLQAYHVCINVNKDTYYRIKRESDNVCGFYGNPEDFFSYTFDYYIFARAARFDNIGKIRYNQAVYDEQTSNDVSLAEYIDNYLASKYNKNCTDGCAIPIKFKANTNLNIDISNISLEYSKEGSPQDPQKNIYDTELDSAKINSEFLKLDLNLANIKVPQSYGNHTLTLYLKNNTITTKKIKVERVPVINSVFPTFVPVATATKFSVSVDIPGGRNITKYKWDFGDETTSETTTSSITHTYFSQGDYDLTIEVTDTALFKSSKKFKINVGSAREIANSTILNYRTRLTNISSEIASLPIWYKSKVEDIIGYDNLVRSLNSLEQEYLSATSDDDYTEIMGNLTGLLVPIKIKLSGEANIPFFVDVNAVNPSYLSDLGAGSYNAEEEEALKKAITAWSEKNLDSNLNFKYVNAIYDDRVENLLSIFNLNIKPKQSLDKELFVVIENKDIIFSQTYTTRDLSDGTGVKFSDISNRNIEFAIAGNVPVDELVLYMSPEFSQLEVEEEIGVCNFNRRCEKDLGENWKNCRNDCKPWGWVIFLLIILFFAAVVAYIALQWWYKEKYESHLFKYRNDLFNIVNFIKNARSQGIKDGEISRKLRDAGWNGEQIGYAFKKIEGKAIMPFDFLKLFKRIERMRLKNIQPQGRLPVSGFIQQ